MQPRKLLYCIWRDLKQIESPIFVLSYWFSFALAYSKISLEYSSMFILWLIWFLCFRFDAMTELGAFMRIEFLCISIFRVASGPRVKLASCKSALNPPVVYSTDYSKALVPVLVLLFVALWFILRGDLFYALPCVILFLCFSVLLAFRLPRLGKREVVLVLFVRLFDCACLDLSVSSSSWCLERAAVCNCGTPWNFLLPLLLFVSKGSEIF